jgi:hypothetical protein
LCGNELEFKVYISYDHWKLVQRITLTWRSKQVSLVNVLLSKDEMSMSIVSERLLNFPSFVGTT